MKTTAIALLCFISFFVFAKEKSPQKENLNKPQGTPIANILNINKFAAWYNSNSGNEREPYYGNAGLTYPRGTATAIYSSGLIYGGILNDNGTTTLKVNGFSYNTGFVPGAILGVRTGAIESESNPDVRIWRIRRDYATIDLAQDAGEFYGKALSYVTQNDIDAIRAQYRKDWQEWPAYKGAPFYDANNDGVYSPQFKIVNDVEVPVLYPQADEPGLANADQVLWFIANDIGKPTSPWGSSSVGMEQQVTVWGYDRVGALGHIAFKKFKFIYKGLATTSINAKIENMYVTHWSDPDLGEYDDDFVGCDTLLSLGYVYNSQSTDKRYRNYNLAPPAIGYDFLQGPIVPSQNDVAVFDLKYRPGYKNLPMTSFIFFGAGGFYSDPPFTSGGAIQWYQMMRGMPPTPQGPPIPEPNNPGMINNPITGLPTPFWLSGDPILHTGWNDGYWDPGGDRRMLQTSGPFTMAIGDTQEIVVGVVGGVGGDRLQSITQMKTNDRFVQFSYDNLFQFIPPDLAFTVEELSPSDLKVTLVVKTVVSQYKSVSIKLMRQNGSAIATVQLFDDGNHGDGTGGDGIFAGSTTVTKESTPASITITVVDKNDKTSSIIKAVEFLTIAGNLKVASTQIYYDNINVDGVVNTGELVHYGISLQNSTIFDLSDVTIQPLSDYEGKGEVYFSTIASGATVAVNNSMRYFSFRVPFDFQGDHYTVPVIIKDGKNNTWSLNIDFPVTAIQSKRDTLAFMPTTNIAGNNDAAIGIIMYNPQYVGREYDIWFGKNTSTTTWTVVKPVEGSDYATVRAFMAPAIGVTNAPDISGEGSFTINDAMNSISFSITVSGLTGSITSAHIHMAEPNQTGSPVKTLNFTNGTAQGVWSFTDLTEPLTPELVKDFVGGRLYVNVHTALNPNGEARGQIENGILKERIYLDAGGFSNSSRNPVITSFENIMDGFSLYVTHPWTGIKSVEQIAPTSGSVKYSINPEQTYFIGFNPSNLGGYLKASELPITIKFNGDENYAMMYPPIISPTATSLYPVRVPFAVFKDTVRVWPIIQNSRYTDSLWNTDSTITVSLNGVQYPTFDRIVGIVDQSDASNNDIRYYSPANTAFPPTSNIMKSRLLSISNHIAKGIVIANVKQNGIPPEAGTQIVLSQWIPIHNGDIKRITLAVLSVERVSSRIPESFALSQNYPNPFNPVTTIQFSVPIRDHVQLKIFDVLGREVAMLANEEFLPGTYAVQFDASRISSGVYFYRLKTTQFTETKRMVLIK